MAHNMEESTVIIVGAGPSGLAAAACLARLSIPYILLEREDCIASLWNKKAYDRLHLHLPKNVCELPHMKFPTSYPRYVLRKEFLKYLDNYVTHFGIKPWYNRNVVSAKFDDDEKKWRIIAKKMVMYHDDEQKEQEEEFVGKFLVVATGETCDPYSPEIEGMNSFQGKIIHSTQYKSGKEYQDKKVLVIGSGNSGFEIALDLANHGATTSLVVRSSGYEDLLNEDGFANASPPNYWKGKNGLYIVGLARRGFYGAAEEAESISQDIKTNL